MRNTTLASLNTLLLGLEKPVFEFKQYKSRIVSAKTNVQHRAKE